jgi:ATP-binding cassette, subfamily B, bacterial
MTDILDHDDAPSTAQRKANFGQIMAYLWGHWTSQPGYLTLVTILMIAATGCELFLPYLSGKIVSILVDGPTAADTAFALFSVFAAVAAGQFFLRNILVRYWSVFCARNMKAITVNSFGDVQRFSSQWHADNFAGATVRRVSRAMWAYDTLSDNFLWYLLPAAIILVGLTTMMALEWPMIGAYVGASILLFGAASIALAHFYISAANERSNSADTAIGAALADAVSANPTVKAFGAEARERTRFEGVVEKWRALVKITWFRYTDGWLVSNLILWGLQVGLLGLVLLEWKAGRASAGDATFALTSYFLIASYLRNLGEVVQQVQRGFADIEDAVAYSLEHEDVADAKDAAAFEKGAGEIVFDRVGFGYKGQDAKLYNDFSLTIKPGETVALVGKTGSGKS